MNRFTLLLGILFNASILGGCTSILPDQMLLPQVAGEIPRSWVQIEGDQTRATLAYCRNRSRGTDCIDSGNDAQGRNNALHQLIAESKAKCERFVHRVVKRSKLSFDANISAQALSGAATLITHNPTTSAITAVSGLANTIASDFDSKYDKEEIKNSLIGIGNLRKSIEDDIHKKMKKKVENYSFERGVTDILDYHSACALHRGLHKYEQDNNFNTQLIGDLSSKLDDLESLV